MNTFLDPLYEKRAYYEVRETLVQDALVESSPRARKEDQVTVAEVREAMHLTYIKDLS